MSQSPTLEVLALLRADANVSKSFSFALVPSYGAIGDCALCLGPCVSCGSPFSEPNPKTAAHIPLNVWEDFSGNLCCGECGADASEFDEGEN